MKLLFALVIGTLFAGLGIARLAGGETGFDPYLFFAAGVAVVLFGANDRSTQQALAAHQDIITATASTVGAMALANMIFEGKLTTQDIRFNAGGHASRMPNGNLAIRYTAHVQALTEAGKAAMDQVAKEYHLNPQGVAFKRPDFKFSNG